MSINLNLDTVNKLSNRVSFGSEKLVESNDEEEIVNIEVF